MKSLQLLALLALFVPASAWTQQAADADRGKLVYETMCDGCHYERVHERDPARSHIRSYGQLRAEIARWASQTGKPISDADQRDIAEYLNLSHYRLDK